MKASIKADKKRFFHLDSEARAKVAKILLSSAFTASICTLFDKKRNWIEQTDS
jgi:hypothetical protein